MTRDDYKEEEGRLLLAISRAIDHLARAEFEAEEAQAALDQAEGDLDELHEWAKKEGIE